MITTLLIIGLLMLFLPMTFIVAAITYHAIREKTILGTMFTSGLLLIMCMLLADLFTKLYAQIF